MDPAALILELDSRLIATDALEAAFRFVDGLESHHDLHRIQVIHRTARDREPEVSLKSRPGY